jgi:lipid II:glycine glycyltransferase (peptidoglycan interpeptide bridge formation enzyme)
LDKDRLHALCGCSTAELNKSIKVVKATCDETILELKNQSTSVARSSRRGKGSIEEAGKEEKKQKEKAGDTKKATIATQSKKRKLMVEEPIKVIIKPVSGIVSMINHQDYLKTKRYAEYKKWKSNLINELTTKI